MADALDLHFVPCHPAEEPARSLIDAMVEEIAGLYGRGGGPPGLPVDPAEMALPGGTYLVGRPADPVDHVGGGPAAGTATAGGPAAGAAAGGGLRTIGPGLGEIKRMYVVPDWRGRGASRLLLGALEDAARAMGLARVRLDTGSRQPAARHLYESTGYRAIADYNGNPYASYWAEKDL